MDIQTKGVGIEVTQLRDTSNITRGIFITFEGGEGAGKSTHIRFLSEALRARGREVLCLREPGGTAIGEQLRSVVLDPANKAMSDETELLIYEAARAQIVAEVIRPALERGAVVLCDRFADSTVAYQVHGRGLSADFVARANEFACQGVRPDRTILLVTGGSAKRGLRRATHRTGADRLELAGEEFHTRVNEAFLRIAEANPDRIRIVESADRKSVTAASVFFELSDLFPWMADASLCDEAFFAPIDKSHSKGKGHRSGSGSSSKGSSAQGGGAQNSSAGRSGGGSGRRSHSGGSGTRSGA